MAHGSHCQVLASLSPRWFILRVFLHRIHAAQFVIDVQLVVVKTKIHARLLWDTSLRTNRNRSMAGWSTIRPGMIIAMPKISRRSRSGGVQVVSSSQCSKTLTRTGGHFQGESLTATCLSSCQTPRRSAWTRPRSTEYVVRDCHVQSDTVH